MPVKVHRTDHGYLVYRLRWKGLPKYESQETTGIKDSRDNRDARKKMQANADLMTKEMATGRFDYLSWFPDGRYADHFREKIDDTTLAHYGEATWMPRMKPPAVRAWAEYDYRRHLKLHILPTLGDLPLASIKTARIVDLRAALLKKGLSMKSARNVIDGTLRACLRDARTVDKLITIDPYADLPPKWWGRRKAQKPDPFTEAERDKLVAHYKDKRRHYYPYILTAFWTGARPSELVALRWGDVDLRAGKLMIQRSRTMGEDNACKTEASNRVIDLVPVVVAALRAAKPLHVTEETFVFVNTEGRSIVVDNFDRVWHPALRATGIRPRKFYATRHTFISTALARGARVKWVATYCGTSLQMIEAHYAKWIGGDADQLALLTEGGMASPEPKRDRDGVPILGVNAGQTGTNRDRREPRKRASNHVNS